VSLTESARASPITRIGAEATLRPDQAVALRAVVTLFVMLNFTTSGGVFAPTLQPGFFAALHSFWIGSGLVEAGRRLLYFPSLGIGHQVLVLALWAVAGAALMAVAASVEKRRTPAPAVQHVVQPSEEVEELEELVVA
jgi:uncharacterized membrane protein